MELNGLTGQLQILLAKPQAANKRDEMPSQNAKPGRVSSHLVRFRFNGIAANFFTKKAKAPGVV